MNSALQRPLSPRVEDVKSVAAKRQTDPISATSNQDSQASPLSSTTSAFGQDYKLDISPEALQKSQNLTPDQKKQVEKLKKRDQEVRAHEEAHLSAAGAYAKGGPKFEYTTGPDHIKYATGGHVEIDTSPIPNDPEKTAEKAEVVKRAALAPGDPSPQDQKVAAEAVKMQTEAMQQKKSENKNPYQNNPSAYIKGNSTQFTKGVQFNTQA